MKIIAITQARVGSSRLPAKVLKKLGSKTLLQLHLERAIQSTLINKLIVATTQEPGADQITAIAEQVGAAAYQGSIDDVLDRYYQAARLFEPDYVVRITSDCPLLDAQLIDEVIRFAVERQVDYVSNTLEASFPDGQDVEVFRFAALEKAWKEATLKSEREHVTAYIWKNSTWFKQSLFTSDNYKSKKSYGDVRLTVDEQKDYETIVKLINSLGADAGWEEYAAFYLDHAEEMSNSLITRNEGYLKSLSTDKS